MTAVAATLRLRRENTLRSRAARGDAAAFAAVYERHHQALYRYCRSILRHEEDAQDALQSTMTRAFAALQDEQRDFELRPWLFRIAHNEAISILRKRRTTTELDDIAMPSELDERVSEREELRLLSLDLADLPDKQRAALVLRELNGLSHNEIAVVLETTPANVKQTIYEARSALFSAREGREMPCDDVRRMLSDGDGRVLRGRGVRAHLRSCSGCRRFQADIDQRAKRLAMLAPPLPTAGAAALLAQILGGGGVAKLLACVAIAGGGATVAAVEFYKPPPQAAAETPEKAREPRPGPAVVTPAPTPVVDLARDKQPREGEPASKRKSPRTKPTPRRRGATRPAPKPDAGAKRGKPERTADPAPAVKTPPGQAERDEAHKTPPGQVKKETAANDPQDQGRKDKPVTPPGQAKNDEPKAQPPGQAKKPVTPGQAKKEATAVAPPGQAKKDDPAAQPPGQAKKDDPAAEPPGQAKKDDPAAEPPGQAKKDDPPGQAKKDQDGAGDE